MTLPLHQRRCGVCTAATPRADADQIRAWSAELDPAWAVVGDRLVRTWRLADFAGALALAVRLGAVAEEEQHHPELTIGWGRLRAELWTHAIGGLSEADFVLAARLDRA